MGRAREKAQKLREAYWTPPGWREVRLTGVETILFDLLREGALKVEEEVWIGDL